GTLPLKYLGLPLVSRKLTAMECRCLTSKLVAKTQAWASKCLSYSGRLQLIQAVLAGIQNFWTSNTIVPIATLKQCEKIMRAYLWAGSTGSSKAKVSWSQVCKPKVEGGLGLRKAIDCNKAAMVRLLWDVIIDRSSLWVRWTTWKYILSLRAHAASNLVYSIGRNSSWSLWYDLWFQNSSLVSKLGSRIIYESGLHRDAPLSEVIQDFVWSWPYHVWQLREISLACSNIPIRQSDVIGWVGEGRAFSFKSAWETLRSPAPLVPWQQLVWFRGAIPKHSFCLWLTFHKAHRTLDKLLAYGIVQQSQC
ncbi:zf-RVT domain-containing protein, partial [Cephalotus follicularis]